MTRDVTRRAFIGTTTVTAAGLLAGCGGSGGSDSDSDGDGGDEATPTDSGGSGDVPAEVQEYLSATGNFDGSVQDETGSGGVVIEVGAQGNGGNFAFAPAAVRVDTGTTVTWTWTGEGGQHNVAHEDGDFESELVSESGHEFQYTFESAGTYLYACTPHESLGMKGAVIVE
jgi:halocyanin-like protein